MDTPANRLQPLTVETWEEVEALFGPKGACGNCWCMWYRLPRKEFEAGKSNGGNRLALHALAEKGLPTGMLAFLDDIPVAWCAFSPRSAFPRLARSRIHPPPDQQPVWSVPCLFVRKEYRRQGISAAMVTALTQYARSEGIGIIEAFPVIPGTGFLPDAFAWNGLLGTFLQAGFSIADQRSPRSVTVWWHANKV